MYSSSSHFWPIVAGSSGGNQSAGNLLSLFKKETTRREREREREREKERKRERECVGVCVSVCVCEREREREDIGGRIYEIVFLTT